MEKVKKIAKYVVNILVIVNALWTILAPVWNLPFIDEISKTLLGVAGVISTYLLGQQLITK